MGKEIRYILLSFSVVLAIFLFAFIWQVRPGYEDELLAQARERQNEQLVNVPEPLATSSQSAESGLDADEVADALLADQSFLDSVAERVSASVPAYVEQYAEAYIANLPEEFINSISERVVDSILADQEAILRAIDSRTEDVVNGILADKEAEYASYITDAVYSQVDSMRAGLETDILSAVEKQIEKSINQALIDAEAVVDQKIADAVSDAEAAVDQKIADAVSDAEVEVKAMISSAIDDAVALYEPQVQAMIDASIASVKQEFEAYFEQNKDALLSLVASNVAENLVQASGRKTGDTDYDRIVYQVSSDVVGALGAKGGKTFDGLDSYKENTYAAIENIVLEVMSRLEEKYAVSPVTVVEEAPVAYSEQASEVQPQEKQALISKPSFSFSTPSASTSDDYAADREEIRRAEIRRVLDGLMN